MKKILPLLASALILSSCSMFSVDNTKTISYSKYLEMVEEKQDFVVFFGTKSCFGCKELRTNLESLRREKEFQTWYYVNLAKLDFATTIQTDLQWTFHQIISHKCYDDLGFQYNSVYTPTILKYVDGNLIYGMIGSIEKEDIELLDSYSFIELSYYQSLFYLPEISLTVYDDSKDDIKIAFKTLYEAKKDQTEKSYFIKMSHLEENEKEMFLTSYNEQNSSSLEKLPDLFTISYQDSL